VEEVCLKTYLDLNCPICLDPPTVAKVSRCGHVFCYVCILRHLSYSPKSIGHCPICFETIYLKDIKSVVIETVHQFIEGDTIRFTLLKRAKHSSIVLPKLHWKSQIESFPLANDPRTKFTRFAITDDLAPIIQREEKELQRAAWEANSSQDDSIPFISMAQDGLEERQNKALQLMRLYKIEKTFQETNRKELNQGFNSVEDITQITEKEEKLQKKDYWNEPVESPLIPLPKIPDHEKQWKFEQHKVLNTTHLENQIEELNLKQREDKKLDSKENFYYLYQSNDAQQLFLHPINFQSLLNQYGSHEKLPDEIEGKILELEDMNQNEITLKRYRFLSHLPLTSQFQFVEIDTRPLVSRDAVQPYLDELQKRSRRRKNQKRKEEEEKRRQEEETKSRFVHLNMRDFPSQFSSDINNYLADDLEILQEIQEPISQKQEETTLNFQTIPKGAWGNNHESITSKQMSPTKTPFLDAVKSNKLHTAPIKRSKGKEKKSVLFSNTNHRNFK